MLVRRAEILTNVLVPPTTNLRSAISLQIRIKTYVSHKLVCLLWKSSINSLGDTNLSTAISFNSTFFQFIFRSVPHWHLLNYNSEVTVKWYRSSSNLFGFICQSYDSHYHIASKGRHTVNGGKYTQKLEKIQPQDKLMTKWLTTRY